MFMGLRLHLVIAVAAGSYTKQMTFNVDVDLSVKVIVNFGSDAKHLSHISGKSDRSVREIATSVTSKLNKPTNLHGHNTSFRRQ